MQNPPIALRAPRPLKVLWKWTGVSAILHVFLIALFCGVSYWGFQKREAALAAKAAAEEAAVKQAEEQAAAQATPEPAKPVETPVPASTPAPVEAEKVLGIDQTAKPEDLKASPFSATGDDLLKDLK